jgi:hypothetical protein
VTFTGVSSLPPSEVSGDGQVGALLHLVLATVEEVSTDEPKADRYNTGSATNDRGIPGNREERSYPSDGEGLRESV